MKLSVIVPTCNRPDHLALCLERFADGAQSLAFADYEIIVTDDSPNQSTEQRVKSQFPWVRWIQGPRRGPAANRNNGARAATHDLVVFCDDDCLPERGLLKAYADAFAANPAVNVLEGRTSAVGEKFHPLAAAPINEGGGCLWSCNFAIRRPLFLGMGGFDERFPFAAMEDSDFHLRLQQRGETILFVKDARILHPWRLGDLKAHWKRHLKSQMIFLRLHPEEAHRFSVVAYWKGIARYYVKAFMGSGRHYGWRVTLGHQPLSWWGFLYTTYVFIVRPNPADMDA